MNQKTVEIGIEDLEGPRFMGRGLFLFHQNVPQAADHPAGRQAPGSDAAEHRIELETKGLAAKGIQFH